MSDRLPARLLAGEVGKPHGLTGEVYVVPISDDPRRFQPGSQLLHERDAVLEIESVRNHGTRLLVKFRGVSSREDAHELRGPLYVLKDDVRSLEEDEYWPQDLVGCEVFMQDERVGSVTDVTPGSAHDLLVVDTPKGTRLIPLVKDIVIAVDPVARTIIVDPPEGLLD